MSRLYSIVLISVFALSSAAWGQTVISENFAGFTAGSIGSPNSTDVGASLNTYTQTPGWTGLKVYQAGGAAKFGTTSVAGYMITPTIDLSGNGGNFSVSIDLQKYGTDASSVLQIFHAPDGATFTQLGSDIVSPASMATYTVTGTGGLATSKIKIAQKNASGGRLYIDNFAVSSGAADLKPVVGVVSCTPVLPALSQDASISATITDDNTVSNARVLYKLNDGAVDSVNMTNVSSTYTGTIPGTLYPNNGDHIEYWVEATDNAGQRSMTAHGGFFVGTTNIATLHAVDGNGVLTYALFYARVTGVATVASGILQTAHLDVYIQDGTQGIEIFKSGSLTSITKGNSYTVVGQLNQYNGKTELIPNDATLGADIIDNGAGVMPSYQLKTVAELYAAPETFEGSVVGIKGCSYVSGTWPATASFVSLNYTDDASANTIALYVNNVTGGPSQPASPSDFIGIFSQNKTGSPFTSGYQLVLRGTSDELAAGALPVELTSFTAAAKNNGVVLSWKTATEANNHGFDVEKNVNGSWTKIAFVAGNGTSNAAHEYSYVDAKAVGSVSYRLKQIDNDGGFKYSTVATIEAAAPKGFELCHAYPNPFNPATQLRFAVPENGVATLIVYNALGQQVATLYNGMAQAGQYITATFNAGQLASGVYIARLQFNGKSMMQKLMLAK